MNQELFNDQKQKISKEQMYKNNIELIEKRITSKRPLHENIEQPQQQVNIYQNQQRENIFMRIGEQKQQDLIKDQKSVESEFIQKEEILRQKSNKSSKSQKTSLNLSTSEKLELEEEMESEEQEQEGIGENQQNKNYNNNQNDMDQEMEEDINFSESFQKKSLQFQLNQNKSEDNNQETEKKKSNLCVDKMIHDLEQNSPLQKKIRVLNGKQNFFIDNNNNIISENNSSELQQQIANNQNNNFSQQIQQQQQPQNQQNIINTNANNNNNQLQQQDVIKQESISNGSKKKTVLKQIETKITQFISGKKKTPKKGQANEKQINQIQNISLQNNVLQVQNSFAISNQQQFLNNNCLNTQLNQNNQFPNQNASEIENPIDYKKMINTIEDLNQKLKLKEIETNQLVLEKMQLKQITNENNQFKNKIRNYFQQTVLENSNLKRRQMKFDLMLKKQRLGEFVNMREGTKFQEVWIDGQEIQDTKQRLNQIKEEKNEIEQKKKTQKITKKVQDIANQILEQKKKSSLYQNMILKEEQCLNEKLEKLEQERNDFIKEYKHIYEEEHSRYGRLTNDPTQNWPILGDKYQLISLLGKGGFSEVYKAVDLDKFQEVAVKLHQLNPNWSENCKTSYVRHAVRENQVHRELEHPNIVRLLDTVEIDDNTFATILELCDGMDLSQYLKKNKIISEKDAKIITLQIVTALKYLNDHHQKIIHYDLKPQNIMFHQGEIKISDFGLCKIMEENVTRLELTSQGVGTYWYLPPETFEENKTPLITTKVDIWSVGIILYELVYGYRPFGNQMSQDRILKEKIILNSIKVNFPPKPSISTDCKDFIVKCLGYKQEDRMDINQAVDHPFLNINTNQKQYFQKQPSLK